MIGISRATVTSVLAGALCGPMLTLPARALDFGAAAAYTYDDNVARAEGAGNVLSDQFFALSANAIHSFQLSSHTRVVASVVAGGEFFGKYDRLSRYFGEIQGELQYRSSGEFAAPTFGLFLKASLDEYDSELRDGTRYSAGVRVLKPLTDRIELFAALAYNKRNAKSVVFDTGDYSARVNVDYALTRRSILYLGAEYRNGDVVSTSIATSPLIAAAEVIELDDAFTDAERFAYRLKADTLIATLGYNWAFGERHSLDFSWRWVQSTAQDSPGNSKPEYRINQLTAAYLFRF
jgi:hypothetical protein